MVYTVIVMKRLLNFEYACIHGTYWMYYGAICSFASVFLLTRGYSNSEIGIILAVANILAVVLQPLMADLADRAKKISVIGITEIATALMMILTVGLFALTGKSLALAVVFVLLIAWHTVLQPLFNSLTFKLEKSGIYINFGVARSMGSLAYSALMAFLGTLVENHGITILPITGEIILVMLMASLFFTKKHYHKAKRLKEKSEKSEEQEKSQTASKPLNDDNDINLLDFIKCNKIFFIINLGVVGVYFSNAVLNNYMIQIVVNVGGSSEDMGRILSVMAFLEIPTMICFNFLRRKFSCQLMLQIAAVGFTVKIAICYIADSVAMIFAAQFFQLVSFALFLPAMVHFINEIMRKGEAVKGQALYTTMITVATVFASLLGGIILDISGAKMLTLIATIATAIGTVIIICSVRRISTPSK